jgi:hypothetical protein
MRWKFFMNTLSAGLIALLCTGCADLSLSVTPRVGQLDASGHIGASTSSVSGTTSLNDLGLDEDDSVPGVRVDAGLVVARVIVSGLQTSISGDGTLSATMSQGGVTLPSGTTVDSSLDYDTLSAYGTFDFIPGDTFELGLGAGITGLKLKGDITSTNPGTPGSVSFDETFAIPVLAVFGAVNLGPIETSALLSGMKLDYSGNNVTYTDIDLMAAWRFLDKAVKAKLAVGWRQLSTKADFSSSGDDYEVDVTLSGPYLGLTIGF